MEINITVTGIDELKEKLTSPDLLGQPIREFFSDIIIDVVPEIQDNTPVDIGQLKASFPMGAPDSNTEIDSSDIPAWATIGTLVDYAPYVEDDTSPHWTSWTNLNEWAYRHDMNVYALQAAIARRGTKGHHMVQLAFDNLVARMPDYLEKLKNNIEGQFGK